MARALSRFEKEFPECRKLMREHDIDFPFSKQLDVIQDYMADTTLNENMLNEQKEIIYEDLMLMYYYENIKEFSNPIYSQEEREMGLKDAERFKTYMNYFRL